MGLSGSSSISIVLCRKLCQRQSWETSSLHADEDSCQMRLHSCLRAVIKFPRYESLVLGDRILNHKILCNDAWNVNDIPDLNSAHRFERNEKGYVHDFCALDWQKKLEAIIHCVSFLLTSWVMMNSASMMFWSRGYYFKLMRNRI